MVRNSEISRTRQNPAKTPHHSNGVPISPCAVLTATLLLASECETHPESEGYQNAATVFFAHETKIHDFAFFSTDSPMHTRACENAHILQHVPREAYPDAGL